MCVAIPGKIIEIYERESLVEFGKIRKIINTSLVEDLKIGDYVLVHVGCAIDKMEEEEARETLEVFKTLGMLE
ncbi:HypC/HybG/HupF family hydrogenase formation chaperone [Clostridium gasigenes]|uniref:Hydrogenase maturation protein HypC n=2 Tax=Clostridium gasigenes TaxID=94869 RepID=A0A1H0LX65_9CLOT|nr:HypC/HybG/HupF family hydrogenase formation chaperone [Clostridium gasigenes]MBB6622343.1 HypC/HybG/HupF family hydrogenase formation chaperone [Clostridium gasigenes]MBB6713857.1 HypC/HybG/HupF family hydrogenase formation chaperone [Clostridium gasigenes]MBU3105872.1 HypC/HybG/HupF family hydrogenase formation chaperone [Clostridium gasigenes]MBU3109515.1 HypC/HybG/HupF family hydrogenase formation chaperone [Clostridium gasigenes]MBU3131063.1 HypC/HybG/HupF family hydrogenase formation c